MFGNMNKLVVILLTIVVLICSSCSRRDAGKSALDLAMHGVRIESVRDLKHSEGGLREQVDELFFHANPVELKEAVTKAGFVRDDTVPEQIRGSNSHFKELAGSADMADAVGFRRADLGIKEGKDCRMLCASDFSWAYLIYVDYGKS